MIFVLGAVLFVLGWLLTDRSMEATLARHFGHEMPLDKLAGGLCLVGAVIMLVSLCMLAWKYLP